MNQDQLYHWMGVIGSNFKDLSVPLQKGLAIFSLAVMESRHCQYGRIARAVAPVLGIKPRSAERRLCGYTGNEKLDLVKFFACWSRMVFERLPKGPIVLSADETTYGNDRYRGMVVGVGFERRSIPLAWRCYASNSQEDYPPEGQSGTIVKLIAAILAGTPPDRQLVVLADRGIGNSPKLCQELMDMGVDLLLRLPKNVTIETEEGIVRPIDKVKRGKSWRGSGVVFASGARIPGHIIVHWNKRYRQPWILVTNNAELDAEMYRKRNWLEQSFRDGKKTGWQLDDTHVQSAETLERLLTILSVALGLALMLGSIAVSVGFARRLLYEGTERARAALSLFKEGLKFWDEEIRFQSELPDLLLLPDQRW